MGRIFKYKQLKDPNWIIKQLETKSLRKIAKEIGSSYGALAYTVRKHGIVSKHTGGQYSGKKNIAKANEKNKLNPRLGSRASNWKGGRVLGNAYYMLHKPDHPFCNRDGYVMEHRYIAEQTIGRYLESHEIIHHIDGNKHNNVPDNLQVVTKKEHARIHADAIKEVARLKKILIANNIPF